MAMGEVVIGGAAVGGYLNRVLFEGDVGIFHEGGAGKGSLSIVPYVFDRFYGGRVMFVMGDEDLDGGLLSLDWSHGARGGM